MGQSLILKQHRPISKLNLVGADYTHRATNICNALKCLWLIVKTMRSEAIRHNQVVTIASTWTVFCLECFGYPARWHDAPPDLAAT